jgi:hypothetical protein
MNIGFSCKLLKYDYKFLLIDSINKESKALPTPIIHIQKPKNSRKA